MHRQKREVSTRNKMLNLKETKSLKLHRAIRHQTQHAPTSEQEIQGNEGENTILEMREIKWGKKKNKKERNSRKQRRAKCRNRQEEEQRRRKRRRSDRK